jgi:hypothetical protein
MQLAIATTQHNTRTESITYLFAEYEFPSHHYCDFPFLSVSGFLENKKLLDTPEYKDPSSTPDFRRYCRKKTTM